MNKEITIEEAMKFMHDGMTVMTGGFGHSGEPLQLEDAICEREFRDIHVISNASGNPKKGVGKWVMKHMVKSMVCSHIGGCPETGRQMIAGETEVTLVPQGTLAERIRCGGMGLGAFLTQTGVGTLVAEGKETKVIDGVEYLVEYPLRAEIALICGTKADRMGNIYYHAGSKNFNISMAGAADLVIAEVNEIVEVGEIDPDLVGTPGILVDYIVKRR